jgi:hypothetical protein
LLLTLPLASVAIAAFALGNPFNGVLFAIGGITVLAFAAGSGAEQIGPGPLWARNAGLLMIAVAWVYPHFLTGSHLAYLYAAPVGLVPCPTLAMAMGFVLLGAGSTARGWTLALAILGAFYGAFGVFRLGVPLDAVLIAGAITLIVIAIHAPIVERRPYARI